MYNLHIKISQIDHHLKPNEKMVALVEAILAVLGKFCPVKIRQKRRFGRLDWNKSKIREAIKTRDKLHQKMVRCKSNANRRAFCKARNQVNLLIRRRKMDNYEIYLKTIRTPETFQIGERYQLKYQKFGK